jgi:hypothetical protein
VRGLERNIGLGAQYGTKAWDINGEFGCIRDLTGRESLRVFLPLVCFCIRMSVREESAP